MREAVNSAWDVRARGAESQILEWHPSTHIWPSGWEGDDRGSGTPEEVFSGPERLMHEVMGGGKRHDIHPTWPPNTSPWKRDVPPPPPPLQPPTRQAGWGLWVEHFPLEVEGGVGALGGW